MCNFCVLSGVRTGATLGMHSLSDGIAHELNCPSVPPLLPALPLFLLVLEPPIVLLATSVDVVPKTMPLNIKAQ